MIKMNLSKISHPCPDSGEKNPGTAMPGSIHNIIFDFGGVICNIDFKITEKEMIRLGLNVSLPDILSSIQHLSFLLETGKITPAEFRDGLRKFYSKPVSDIELDNAWNALLLDIPEPRVRLLEKIRKYYRIFLLSNSNEIHYRKYSEDFRKQYGYADLGALFEKTWFSFQTGFHKPSKEIYLHALGDAGLKPAETLFIDDTLMHVEGALAAGIHAHHLRIDQGEQIMDLFI